MTQQQAFAEVLNGCSVVIPVYNSEQSLPELVQRLGSVLPQVCADYEIILVNDGSRDHSWQQIQTLMAQSERVKGFNLLRNYGQHNALLCGIRKARYERVITMDDDLQHPPEEIPKLLDKLSQGYDVVYGITEQEQHGLWRDLASRITKLVLQNAMGVETARNVSAFRAFRTQIRAAFVNYNAPFVFIDALLTWGTTNFTAIPVQHQKRRYGQSNYTFRRLVIHMLNMVTGFSLLPLQLASLMGFGFTFAGFILFIYVIVRYLVQGGSVPGFPFLASTIIIFSGIQLFTLGIIGEYLSRIYLRTMGRPAYVVKDEPS